MRLPLLRTFVPILLAALLLGPAHPAHAGDSALGSARAERPMIFSSAGYMPFFSGEAGASALEYGGHGMLVDLLDAFEKAYPEYAFKRVRLPRVRANEWLSRDLAAGYALHSRFFGGLYTEHFDYSLPLWHTEDHVYVRQDDGLRFERPEDLRGVLLGVIRGFGYGPLDPLLRSGEIPCVSVETDRQLYRLLLDGRVRAIVGNEHVLPYSMYRYGLNPLRVKSVGPPLYEFELSVLIRRDHPEIMEALNAFILTARENGLMDRIQRRWLGESCPGVKY